MTYAVQMSSGAMIYTPSFIKISSSFQKLIEGGITQRDRVSKVIS
jgi:hypothetical protein